MNAPAPTSRCPFDRRACLEGAIKKTPKPIDSWWALASLYVDEMIDRTPFEIIVVRESGGRRREGREAGAAKRARPCRPVRAFAGASQRARDAAETAIALSPNDSEVLGPRRSTRKPACFSALTIRSWKLRKINPNYPNWMNYSRLFLASSSSAISPRLRVGSMEPQRWKAGIGGWRIAPSPTASSETCQGQGTGAPDPGDQTRLQRHLLERDEFLQSAPGSKGPG